MKNQILIVEDTAIVASQIASHVESEGFGSRIVNNAEDALTLLVEEVFAAAIVDRMLPGMPGDELVLKAREEGVTTPIIILTGYPSESSLKGNLENGADDYMSKPYSRTELIARIRARLRDKNKLERFLSVGKYKFDTKMDILTCDGSKPVALQSRQYRIFEALMRAEDYSLSVHDLIREAYGDPYAIVEHVLGTNVSRINTTFRKLGLEKVITYRKGHGYELIIR